MIREKGCSGGRPFSLFCFLENNNLTGFVVLCELDGTSCSVFDLFLLKIRNKSCVFVKNHYNR